jgi:two-component system, NtrC family, response regulator AtoC
VLRILSRILQKNGLEVTAANSGQEALKKIESQTYDVTILDVNLGSMNGLDLLPQITKSAPDMKTMILTGYPSDEDRIRAQEQGAEHYLSKPIKSEKLVEIVKQTIK